MRVNSYGRSTSPQRDTLFLVCRAPGALLSRFIRGATTNRKFGFAFVASAVVAAKIIHLLARQNAMVPRDIALWTLSFFMQDFVLLVALRFLGEWLQSSSSSSICDTYSDGLHTLGQILSLGISIFAATISIISVTFFWQTNTEVRWRDVGFAGESGSSGILLAGLGTLMMVLAIGATIAGVLDKFIYMIAGAAVDVVKWPLEYLLSLLRRQQNSNSSFARVPSEEFEDTDSDLDMFPEKLHDDDYFRHEQQKQTLIYRFFQGVWSVFIALQIISYTLRPHEGALVFMSWTTPLIPFVDYTEAVSILRNLQPHLKDQNISISHAWDDRTALTDPIPLDWLPRDTVLPGFEDWYEPGRKHYNAAADPLKVSNLDQPLLPGLNSDSLADISIKHIVLLVLESTRKDVFPVRKDGLIWRRFEDAAPQKVLSDEAIARLETLTPTANYLTGDYDDGFEHDGEKPRRGGISFRDANSAATYTRKSMVGIMCGAFPLVADFNKEYLHHVYQPCLPQILEAFSQIDNRSSRSNSASSTNTNANFDTTMPWRSHYLQSITLGFDHAYDSTSQFGFPDSQIIGSRYLRSPSAKFGPVDLPDINYFGMEEAPLLSYIRDTFSSAKAANERVFLTHLTSTTHHPYSIPDEDTEYVPLADGRWSDLSHYVNAVGYDDRWLGKVLRALDDEGVADETLVVVTGDHGLSLPENNTPATYHNPNAGCNHVPLVISHPGLPPIEVDDAVSNMEILPTVLDLLRETGSLSKEASRAAGDLAANYEGQSLIRRLLHNSNVPLDDDEEREGEEEDEYDEEKQGEGQAQGGEEEEEEEERGEKQAQAQTQEANGLGSWQFIVMNPGRAMFGVRDRRRKHWRLVVPVIHNVEWQFSDLEQDRTDNDRVQAFGFDAFLEKVRERHGEEQARWAEEAAFVGRWWAEENNKRWEYGLYSLKGAV